MWSWRMVIKRYQTDIEYGYQKIIQCECKLHISDDISIKGKIIKEHFPELLFEKKSIIESFEDYKISNSNFKEYQCRKLLDKFKNHKYVDSTHMKLDYFAHIIMVFGIALFVISIYSLIFSTNCGLPTHSCYLPMCCCY